MQNVKNRINPNLKVERFANHSFQAKEMHSLVVKCTACSCIIDYNDSTALAQHPILKVLLCSLCLKRNMETFARNDNESSYCLWCSQKQHLITCVTCTKSFCIECIERNLGSKELNSIDSKNWCCYACDPMPLEDLISFSEMMMEYGSESNDDDDDSDDGNMQKDLERECWLDYHMDSVRHQIEDVGEHLYHLKIKLRRERAMAKDFEGLNNKFIERVEVILADLLKNIKNMLTTLKTKQQKIQKLNVEFKQRESMPLVKDAKAVYKKEHILLSQHESLQHVDKSKTAVNQDKKVLYQQPQMPKFQQKPDPNASQKIVQKIKTSTSITKPPVPTAIKSVAPSISPPSYKLLNNILHNPEIMVKRSSSIITKTKADEIKFHDVVIKKEPLSPKLDEPHDKSPTPPKPPPPALPIAKPPKMKISAARFKHSEKKPKPFEAKHGAFEPNSSIHMNLEAIKSAASETNPIISDPKYMNVVIKQEPPEESPERAQDNEMYDEKSENKSVPSSGHFVIKQEPLDDEEKEPEASQPANYPTKKFKFSDKEEDYSACKNTKLLEELMSRKDISIQPTQQSVFVSSAEDMSNLYVQTATSNTNVSQLNYVQQQQTTPASFKHLMEAEEEDEEERHALFDSDPPTKASLPSNAEYNLVNARTMNRQSMSAVIDLLKGDSNPEYVSSNKMMLSEDEDMSGNDSNKDEDSQMLDASAIKQEPIEDEEDQSFVENGGNNSQHFENISVSASLSAKNSNQASNVQVSGDSNGSSNGQPAKNHICKECGLNFPTYKLLVQHFRMKHSPASALPSGPPSTEKQQQQQQRMHRCTICPYSSDKIANLRSHMRTHTDERPFNCVFCEKRFKQVSNLNKHMKIHTDADRAYSCKDCLQTFATQAKLKKHKFEGCPGGGASQNPTASAAGNPSTSVSAPLNQCQYCEKTFPDVEQLNGHLLTHFVSDGTTFSPPATS